ncbi:MAG: hypothetical protein SGJ17_07675 [Hyphomicrobiales bacterium]|nr:hypothetical protein [Hyphomicrobiales bacterium]
MFKQLNGSWRGSGAVRLQGGNERISCRGYYNVKSGGSGLSIAIRCAAPSYRIEMRSNVTDSGGRLSGNWEERTFNAEGALSGSVTGSSVNLSISGVITGSMSISVNGSSHQVNLSASGPRFKGMSLSMSRG